MRMRVNDIELNADMAGPADAPVVMLSHSLASSRVMWDPQLTALSRDWRVVRFDTRGHGLSDAPGGPYTLDGLADDALALVDRLELLKVHWVGLSMGGMLGQSLALRHPGRLASLTLCDTMARVPPELASAWDARIAIAESEGMAPLLAPTLERWFTAGYRAKNPPGMKTIGMELMRTPVQGYVGCCHAIRQLDFLDRLGGIRLPTLVIVGADDPATPPAASEAIRDRIAGAELVVLADASHIANVEQPAAFDAALLPFLARHRAR